MKTANLLGQTPGIKLEEHTGTQHFTLPMNCTVAPFDNVDVRLALKYAIDREAPVKAILFGHGLPANDHSIAPANIDYAGDIEQRKFDPDKAKFHLKKAGLDKLKVDLSAADTASREQPTPRRSIPSRRPNAASRSTSSGSPTTATGQTWG